MEFSHKKVSLHLKSPPHSASTCRVRVNRYFTRRKTHAFYWRTVNGHIPFTYAVLSLLHTRIHVLFPLTTCCTRRSSLWITTRPSSPFPPTNLTLKQPRNWGRLYAEVKTQKDNWLRGGRRNQTRTKKEQLNATATCEKNTHSSFFLFSRQSTFLLDSVASVVTYVFMWAWTL